jgi:hypothetical protein
MHDLSQGRTLNFNQTVTSIDQMTITPISKQTEAEMTQLRIFQIMIESC